MDQIGDCIPSTSPATGPEDVVDRGLRVGNRCFDVAFDAEIENCARCSGLAAATSA
jgi:hypothetical protein